MVIEKAIEKSVENNAIDLLVALIVEELSEDLHMDLKYSQNLFLLKPGNCSMMGNLNCGGTGRPILRRCTKKR